MARAAVEQAWPEKPEAGVLELRDVVWAEPLVVEKEKEVHIELSVGGGEEGEEEIEYEIYSSEEGEEEVVHCQGRAVWRGEEVGAERVQLEQLKREKGWSEVEGSRVYERFREMGFEYGPAQQGIGRLQVRAGEVLGELRLGGAGEAGQEAYVLHPGLLD